MRRGRHCEDNPRGPVIHSNIVVGLMSDALSGRLFADSADFVGGFVLGGCLWCRFDRRLLLGGSVCAVFGGNGPRGGWARDDGEQPRAD